MDNSTETFEISLRLFGTEIIGLKLSSESTRKIWVAIALLAMTALGFFMQWMLPYFQAFFAAKH